MNAKKKKFSSIGTLIFVVSILMTLGGCGSSNKSGGLTLMIWDTFQEPGIRQMTEIFTEETGISVDVQVVTWNEYWTLLQAGAQGGELPDVFWMHSNEFQRYADNNMLLDMTDLIANSDLVDLNYFYEDIVELYNFNGRQYAVPKDVDTIALWYNRALFMEAGVELPNNNWTWYDLLDAAIQLTDLDAGQYGFAWNVDNAQDGWYNLIYSYGGYVISGDRRHSGFDNPNTIEAMRFLQALLEANVMPSLETLSENGTNVLFESGMLAMSTFGSWMVQSFASNDVLLENLGIVMLPTAPNGNRVSIYNGLGWAASADGSNTDSAWELIEFLGSERMQYMQADLGITMSALKGTSNNWVNSVPEFNLQAHLNMLDYIVMFPYSRNTLVWSRMSQELLQSVWLGQRSMDDVLLEIAEEMNNILAQE